MSCGRIDLVLHHVLCPWKAEKEAHMVQVGGALKISLQEKKNQPILLGGAGGTTSAQQVSIFGEMVLEASSLPLAGAETVVLFDFLHRVGSKRRGYYRNYLCIDPWENLGERCYLRVVLPIVVRSAVLMSSYEMNIHTRNKKSITLRNSSL